MISLIIMFDIILSNLISARHFFKQFSESFEVSTLNFSAGSIFYKMIRGYKIQTYILNVVVLLY